MFYGFLVGVAMNFAAEIELLTVLQGSYGELPATVSVSLFEGVALFF